MNDVATSDGNGWTDDVNGWNFLGARRIANSSNQIRRVLFDWQGIGACTSLFEHSRDNKNSKSKIQSFIKNI